MASHEDIQALAMGYALGTLEREEAGEFSEHLASCAECRELVSDAGAIVAAMPATVPSLAPPPALKTRVMDAVRAQELQSVERPAPERPRGPGESPRAGLLLRWPVGAFAAAAAVLLLALAATGAWAFSLQDRLDTNQARLSNLYDAMTVLAEAEDRWEFSGSSIEPGARGLIAHSSENEASVLIVWEMPPQTEGQTYVAWTATEDGTRHGVGPMRRSNGGLWVMVEGDITAMDTVGITLRDVDAPEGEQVRDVVVVPLSRYR